MAATSAVKGTVSMVMCAAGYASFSARTVGVAKITSPMKAKSMTKIRSPATLPPPFHVASYCIGSLNAGRAPLAFVKCSDIYSH